MQPNVHVGPSLVVKLYYPTDNSQKTIGYASGLTFTVTQGQKAIFVVDTPFPAEIAQGAAPSMVRGSMNLYLPKGTTMESAGLVPYRTNPGGENAMAASKYLNIRLVDRLTQDIVLEARFCKVNQYTIDTANRSVVMVRLSFEGRYCDPGGAGT